MLRGVYDRCPGHAIHGLDAHRLHRTSNTGTTHFKACIGEVMGKHACTLARVIHEEGVDQTHAVQILITGRARGGLTSIAMNIHGCTLLENVESTLVKRWTS